MVLDEAREGCVPDRRAGGWSVRRAAAAWNRAAGDMLPMAMMVTPLPPVASPGALFVAALLAGGSCGRGPAPREPLACSDPQVDFGRVFEGSVLKHEWKLELAAPLTVTATHTDCGC